MDVLKAELQKVDNDVLMTALKEELRNSYAASQEDLDYVEEEFTSFCRNQEMKSAILESADLLKGGDFDGIRNLVEKAIKAGMDKSIGHEYNKDIESRYRVDYRPTIPTPWPILNNGIQGGFGPGDLGIGFGSPGGSFPGSSESSGKATTGTIKKKATTRTTKITPRTTKRKTKRKACL